MKKLIKIILILFAFCALAASFAGLFLHRKKAGLTIDFAKALTEPDVVPVVVIGSGPAGLSTALYTARAAVYTVVFEGQKPGGQLTETTYVENWPGTPKLLGSQLIDQNRKQAEKFGALMVRDMVVSADFSTWPFVLKTEEGAEIHALCVIIATGANPRKLNDTRKVPGETEYWGYGVTTCAVCDAPFYKGKDVVVVGGGDSAVEEATLLTAYAENVTLLVRGSAMRAAPAMQARLQGSSKIKVLYNTEITEIMGTGNEVTGVQILNSKDKQTRKLEVNGVFLAIGHKPNSQLVKDALLLDSEGYIILPNRSQQTTLPGVFAAGDVADRVYRQAGVAAGDGIKAALDAIAFLQEHGYKASLAKELEKNYWYPHAQEALEPLKKITNNKEFDALAKEHSFVVVEVGAQDCASCKSLMPIVQAVSRQFAGKASFAAISLDDDPKELIKRFDLKAIPVVLVFRRDKLIARYDQQLFTKRELTVALNQLFAEN